MRILPFSGTTLILAACCGIIVSAEELPTLTIVVSDGNTYRGTLDPKTSPGRLWLRFGGPTTAIRRGFDWQTVLDIRAGEQRLSPQDIANLIPDSPTANRPKRIVIPPAESDLDLTTNSPLRESGRIADVRFDVVLGNWDQDIEMDGLLVQVLPVNAAGDLVAARGNLMVELFSTYRIDQDAAPHGRGSAVRSVGRWSTQVDSHNTKGWIRLPFQASHPEYETKWSPFGLVHIEFVAVGQGVFQRSLDGVRIRPWGPFRDGLERGTGGRFLPSELR